MHKTLTDGRRDGWTLARRTCFLEALRIGGTVADACTTAGMSVAGAYALMKRDPGFAAARDAALAARSNDRRPVRTVSVARLDDAGLMRKLRTFGAILRSRPRGIVAQQKTRRA